MLRFGAKVPGLGIDVRSVTMDFTYGSAFSVDSPDAYETLILDALLGDASLFTRADEVEGAWAIVTPIIEAWASEPPPTSRTTRRARGAREADELLAGEGRSGGASELARSPPLPRPTSRHALAVARHEHRGDRAGARPDLGPAEPRSRRATATRPTNATSPPGRA